MPYYRCYALLSHNPSFTFALDMDPLEQKRESYEKRMQATEQFCNNISDKTRISEIRKRLEKCEIIYNEYVKNEDKIMKFDNYDSAQFLNFEEMYFRVTGILEEKIHCDKKDGDNSNLNSTICHLLETQKGLLETSRAGVYDLLPTKMKIDPFNGDSNDPHVYQKWITFHDLFSSSVHKNTKLSKSQKFQLLKSNLIADGEAHKIVSHLNISDVNYDDAWAKLNERYNKPKFLIASYIQTFLDQPKVTSVTAAHIRNFANTCDEVRKGLNSLGPEANERDAFVVYIMLSKIDTETKRLWSIESKNSNFPREDEFIEFLYSRADSLEMSQIGSNIDRKTLNSNNNVNKSQRLKSFHSSNSNKKCSRCSGNHSLYKCLEFKSLDAVERGKVVKNNSLCYNCLAQGHGVRDCKSKFKCHFCKARHHSLLHVEPSSVDNESNTNTNNVTQSSSHTHSQTNQPSLSSLTTFISNSQTTRTKHYPHFVTNNTPINFNYLNTHNSIEKTIPQNDSETSFYFDNSHTHTMTLLIIHYYHIIHHIHNPVMHYFKL